MSRFQGGRSRWVDVLLGLVVLLLIAGFAYMLLGNRQNTPPATAPQQVETSPEIPVAPGSESETPEVAAANEDVETATAVEELPEDDGFEPPNEFDDDFEGDAETEIAPAPVAVAPSETPNTPLPPSNPEPPAATETPRTTPAPRAEADSSNTNTDSPSNNGGTPPTNSARPRAGGAVPTSAARVPTRSEYRISLGGFDSSPQAVQRTAAVAGIGYTVYSIDLGNQVVAQVGPFANAARARAALADIQRVYPAAALFAPKAGATPPTTPAPSTTPAPPPSPAPAQSSRPTQTRPAQSNPVPANNVPANNVPPAAPQQTPPPPARQSNQSPERVPQPTPQPQPKPVPKPTPEPAPQPAPAPAEPVPQPAPAPTPAPAAETYLQVGAFEDFEKAQELVERLQGQGFSPSVNAPEGQMAKVLIGPFGPSEVGAAEARLDASGYDHFRLR